MENTNAPAAHRPRNLNLAVGLFAAALLLGIPRWLLEWPALVEDAAKANMGPGFVVATQVISLLIVGGLLLLTWFRFNWAKWIYTVLTVAGIPFSAIPLLYALKHSPISAVLGILQVILQIAGLMFLFRKDSTQWFRARKQTE